MSDKQLDQNQMMTNLVRDLLKEKRSEKRWKNVRFFVGFMLVVLVGLIAFSGGGYVTLLPTEEKGYVAYLKMEGVIEPGREFSAEQVLPLLKDAFADTKAKGVVIDIDSGGGTPVQASIIHNAIVDLKTKYHKKVIVVGEDTLASGAYFVAVAGDKIYVNPNTITGSIGVIMKGFGFPDLIKKLGVERRVYTSGINKDRLDPFLPQNPVDADKIRTVTSEIHENFKQVVLQGRKGKLQGDPNELFSGDFWSGQTALKLGLVDALGNLTDVLRNEFNVGRYKDYSSTPGLAKSLANQFGLALDFALNNDSVRALEKI